jgi:predicted transcriptional regulator
MSHNICRKVLEIKNTRKALEIPFTVFADRCDIDHARYANIESGRLRPKRIEILAMYEVLDEEFDKIIRNNTDINFRF